MKRMLALGLLLCVALLLVPQSGFTQSKQDAMRLYKEADKLGENPKSRDDLMKAVQKFEQAMRIFEKLGHDKEFQVCATNAGIIYAGWGEYPKAIEYYEKSLAICRKIGDHKGNASTI
jgi:tetratricopeptide (TPR) repeat protein